MHLTSIIELKNDAISHASEIIWEKDTRERLRILRLHILKEIRSGITYIISLNISLYSALSSVAHSAKKDCWFVTKVKDFSQCTYGQIQQSATMT